MKYFHTKIEKIQTSETKRKKKKTSLMQRAFVAYKLGFFNNIERDTVRIWIFITVHGYTLWYTDGNRFYYVLSTDIEHTFSFILFDSIKNLNKTYKGITLWLLRQNICPKRGEYVCSKTKIIFTYLYIYFSSVLNIITSKTIYIYLHWFILGKMKTAVLSWK